MFTFLVRQPARYHTRMARRARVRHGEAGALAYLEISHDSQHSPNPPPQSREENE
jgi:hypothetical protein